VKAMNGARATVPVKQGGRGWRGECEEPDDDATRDESDPLKGRSSPAAPPHRRRRGPEATPEVDEEAEAPPGSRAPWMPPARR
jgi:hypothetical protein